MNELIAIKLKELTMLILENHGLSLDEDLDSVYVHDVLDHPKHSGEIDEYVMTLRIDLKTLGQDR